MFVCLFVFTFKFNLVSSQEIKDPIFLKNYISAKLFYKPIWKKFVYLYFIRGDDLRNIHFSSTL